MFATLIDSSICEQFLCSCNAVGLHFTYSKTSFKIGSSSLKSCYCFVNQVFSKYFVVVSTDFTASLPGVDSISRNHCFCSSTRSNSSFLEVLLWDYDNSVLSSGSTSNSSFPAIATRSAVPSSTSLEPLKVIHEGWNQHFQTLVHIDILAFSHESQVFLMASRMVNPFQKLAHIYQRNHCWVLATSWSMRPKQGARGSIPSRGARSHMPQQRSKIPSTTTKTYTAK